TDANYITVTTAALTGITTQGSILLHINRGNGSNLGSAGNSVVFSVNTTSNGNFFFLYDPTTSTFRYPTTAGYAQVNFSYSWLRGRSYTVIFNWSGTAYNAYVAEDQPTK